MKLDYKGWTLKAYKHIYYPPYKDYNCSCWKDFQGKSFMFNVEGSSLKQAINIAKERIDDGDYNLEWHGNLDECEFI